MDWSIRPTASLICKNKKINREFIRTLLSYRIQNLNKIKSNFTKENNAPKFGNIYKS